MGLHIIRLTDEERDALGTVVVDAVEDLDDVIAEYDGDAAGADAFKKFRDLIRAIRRKL